MNPRDWPSQVRIAEIDDELAVDACRPVAIKSIFRARGGCVMPQLGEDKLIALLKEIHFDIRQIKSDLQSLLTLLKQQQQQPTSPPFFEFGDTTKSDDDGQSGSPEQVLRYLRETRGEDGTGE